MAFEKESSVCVQSFVFSLFDWLLKKVNKILIVKATRYKYRIYVAAKLNSEKIKALTRLEPVSFSIPV